MAGLVSTLVNRLDDWRNTITNLGGPLSRAEATQMTGYLCQISDAELQALYTNDHIAHKAVAWLPDEATSLGFEVCLEDDEELESRVNTRLDELGACEALRLWGHWDRLYGGSAIWMVVDDGAEDQSEPLRIDAIHAVVSLRVIDRTRLRPRNGSVVLDPMDVDFLKPEVYEVVRRLPGQRTSGAQVVQAIHRSRLLILDGADTVDDYRDTLQGWGLSILQVMYAALRRNADANLAAGQSLTQASFLKIGFQGLIQQLTAGQEEAVKARLQMINDSRSMAKAVAYDTNDRIDTEQVSFSGFPDMVKLAREDVASAAGMPVTKLWGVSASGLNATGEGDADLGYVAVNKYRRGLTPHIDRLVDLILRAEGVDAPEWEIEWPELAPLSDLERADRVLKVSQAAALLVGNEILTPEEAALGMWGPEGISDNLGQALNRDARQPMVDNLDLEAEAEQAAAQAQALASATAAPPPENGPPDDGTDG